jgi:PemK-like, MazF-like toxin of type II toxin-antitoxin system
MTAYNFGDVILVPFPFTDLQQSKQRPAVIVSSARYHAERPDLILMAITSQVRSPPAFAESLVRDWRAAGLLKPSVENPSSPPSSSAWCAKPSAASPRPTAPHSPPRCASCSAAEAGRFEVAICDRFHGAFCGPMGPKSRSVAILHT